MYDARDTSTAEGVACRGGSTSGSGRGRVMVWGGVMVWRRGETVIAVPTGDACMRVYTPDAGGLDVPARLTALTQEVRDVQVEDRADQRRPAPQAGAQGPAAAVLDPELRVLHGFAAPAPNRVGPHFLVVLDHRAAVLTLQPEVAGAASSGAPDVNWCAFPPTLAGRAAASVPSEKLTKEVGFLSGRSEG
jgi:hypothetical protein